MHGLPPYIVEERSVGKFYKKIRLQLVVYKLLNVHEPLKKFQDLKKFTQYFLNIENRATFKRISFSRDL